MKKAIKSTAVIITIGPWHEKPWWWSDIKDSIKQCNLEYIRISHKRNKKEAQLALINLPEITLKIIKIIHKKRPKYVFTFECGWASIVVCFLQAIGFVSFVRHVIIQFIMREKEKSFNSKVKYLFMRLIFSSIYMAVCSSYRESLYYAKEFKLKKQIFKFVPLHSSPNYLKIRMNKSEEYLLSAGRTFRDYDTFFKAVSEIDCKVIVVASPDNIKSLKPPENVRLKFDISIDNLSDLINRSSIVVIPLEDKKISIGQSVILQAMALGKPVIATKTAGTENYIEHLVNGILVPPKDTEKMRIAIKYLLDNEKERERIGKEAKKKIINAYLPKHYIKKIKKLLPN